MAGKGTNPTSRAQTTRAKPPAANSKAAIAAEVMNPPHSRPVPRTAPAAPAPRPSASPPIPGWQPQNTTRGLEIADANRERLTQTRPQPQPTTGREALTRNLERLGGSPNATPNRLTPQPNPSARAAFNNLSPAVRGGGILAAGAAATPILEQLIRRAQENGVFDRISPNNQPQQQTMPMDNSSMAEGRRESRVDYGMDEIAQENMRRETAAPRPVRRQTTAQNDDMSTLLNRANLSGQGRAFIRDEAPGITDEAELRRRLRGFSPDVEMSKGGYVKMAKGGMVSCEKPKKMAKGGLAGTFDMPGMSDTPGRAPQNRRPKTMKNSAKPKVKAAMKAKNNMPMPKMAKGGMTKKGNKR